MLRLNGVVNYKELRMMNYFLACVTTYIYFMTVVIVLKLATSGFGWLEDFIVYYIVYYILYISVIILVGSIVIESISKVILDKAKAMILVVGFIYGMAISILFGSDIDLDNMSINIITGIIISLGFFIYYLIRQKNPSLQKLSVK